MPPRDLRTNDRLHGHFRTLVTVIRVNHTWFACGINLLWRAPPCALAKITKDRRQLYATCVHRLSFEENYHGFLSQLEGLAFPHLQRLSIDTSTCSPKEYLRFVPYLAPSVLELIPRGAIVEPSVFSLLPKRSPIHEAHPRSTGAKTFLSGPYYRVAKQSAYSATFYLSCTQRDIRTGPDFAYITRRS